ncbi:MAG: hypothetical protein JO266_11820 [Acidobacteria bacterium]|nr:hypothetical protein [Acidobacteriota bacterium]MBV8892638.1 hypothetical protein [Acidobacteriota bacterium]MBV9479554.1 hypothetical protein [Acidobacteriota bacterium]
MSGWWQRMPTAEGLALGFDEADMSQSDSLDLILGEPLFRPIVKLGGA